MRTSRLALAGVVVTALTALALSPAAGTARVSATPLAPAASGTATLALQETGRAYHQVDGDTFWVCLTGRTCTPGDVTPSDPADFSVPVKSVRLRSVQTLELPHRTKIRADAKAAGVKQVTTAECHADEARKFVNALVFGTTEPGRAALGRDVRLYAHAKSSSSYGRLRRSVEVNVYGAWVDVEAKLLDAGHAMWLPLNSTFGEYAGNTRYRQLAAAAQKAHRNLWDTDYCGVGPAQSAKLALDVKWDADGNDFRDVNGEWVRVRNTGKVSVDLKGWTLRTAGWDMYTWGWRTVLAPGSSVTVHSGRAPAHPATGQYYVGSTGPFYQNVNKAQGLGGGAYLMDTDGDMRSWQMYPYTDKPKGATLKITKVLYDAPGDDRDHVNGEYIAVKNTGRKSLSLAPYLLKVGGTAYSFAPKARLSAGKSVKVRVGKGKSTTSTKHWGKSKPLLANAGGVARLQTYDAYTVSCRSWKKGSC